MSKPESSAKTEMPLSTRSSFEIIDLPDENRNDVLKVVNPGSWNVAYYKLGNFRNQLVNIKFSADVKRTGATGDLRWQVNSDGYPIVGDEIKNAETDTWHSMTGEWTGMLISNRVFYLSTYENNSKTTTYYIDNFNIKIETIEKSIIKSEPMEKRDFSNYRKTLVDMAKYLKDLIPINIPEFYDIKPVFKSIAEEESVRSGVLAYRDFLYFLCERLTTDGSLYDKPPKKEDYHASMAVRYPLLNNVKNVLINIGYHGKFTDNGALLMLSGWEQLTSTVMAGGGKAVLKLTVPKLIEALKFLTSCGIYFDGIDLNAPKPDMSKISSIAVTCPDNSAMLMGLKVMAVAQKDLNIKDNDEIFLRCDYRVLMNEEQDVTALLKDFIRPLPTDVQDFALKLHRRYLDAGLTCKPKVFFLNFQFTYFYKNKEIWSFYASLASGYRILVKAQNTHKYADVIEKFPLPLQEQIALGYGCNKSRLDGPCQKGCHGFSFSLNDSLLEISRDMEIWLDRELACLKRK